MNKAHSPEAEQIVISEDQAGQRLDNFLLRRLKGVPKSRIYRAIRGGEVRVNKGRVKAEYRLEVEDCVRLPPLRQAAASVASKCPEQRLLDLVESAILHEDQNFIILNKPAGMAVHGGSGLSFGVIELLRYARPQLKTLELAHRLDRDTSGCLLIAKKPSVLKELHELFKSKTITKTYLALVHGRWQGAERTVSVSLLKNQLSSGERIVRVSAEGKSARTEFRPLRRYADATLLEARPQTGRTHQIRVHAAHLNHPLIGDQKYCPSSFPHKKEWGKRLFLHAAALEFTLPSTGQKFAVCACLDKEFLRVLKAES